MNLSILLKASPWKLKSPIIHERNGWIQKLEYISNRHSLHCEWSKEIGDLGIKPFNPTKFSFSDNIWSSRFAIGCELTIKREAKGLREV